MLYSNGRIKILLIALAALLIVALLAAAFGMKSYTNKKLSRMEPPYPSSIRGDSSQADIVLFGDSRAANWKLHTLSSLGSADNAGIRGDVTISMVNRLDTDVLARQPKFVILVAGINDAVTGSLLPEKRRRRNLVNTKCNLDQLVNKVLESNAKLIILTITPPYKMDILRRLLWGKGIEADVQSLNLRISQYGENNRVFVIDTEIVFRQIGDDWINVIRRDTLHYTQRAYDLLDQAVVETIRSQGGV